MVKKKNFVEDKEINNELCFATYYVTLDKSLNICFFICITVALLKCILTIKLFIQT